MFQPLFRSTLRRGLTLSATAFITTALTPLAAHAQDATWSGPGNNFNDPVNWTPTTVPTNRATFLTNPPTVVSVTAPTAINQIRFGVGANAYTIINLSDLTINGIGGVGVENQSSAVQQISNLGSLTLNDASILGGTGGFLLFNDGTNSTAALTLNGTSQFGTNADLQISGGDVVANGNVVIGGIATTTFNDTSGADGRSIVQTGGTAVAVGFGGNDGVAVGGSAVLAFNQNAHADTAEFDLSGGGAVAVDSGAGATAVAGASIVTFNDSSHADGATFNSTDGGTTSVASFDGFVTTAVGGGSTIQFNGTSHADNAEFNNTGAGVVSVGGSGRNGTPGNTGAAGGVAIGVGGGVSLNFLDNSHANGATITNLASAVTAVGGTGGIGDTGAGGDGGSAQAFGASVGLNVLNNTHLDNATIDNSIQDTLGVGGAGGAGGAAGAGGNGGSSFAFGGIVTVLVNNTASVSGTVFNNTAGNAEAHGGSGGTGGAGGNGGTGGQTDVFGGSATITFAGTVTLGAGNQINNRSGDAEATGGQGGTGGAGGAGGTGGVANATGGAATVRFEDSASAGSATIVNTGGAISSTGGDGGDGGTGNGGNGGFASATQGKALIEFTDTSTAGSATIQNVGGPGYTLAGGFGGMGGPGGGAGGSGGSASIAFDIPEIRFSNSATGGSAHITNTGGLIDFEDNAVFGTAAGGGARIDNLAQGFVAFNGSSSLGNGRIVNGNGAVFSFVTFADSSTAGSGTITNNALAFVDFIGNSTMGTATVTNSGTVDFNDASDAVAGSIVNNAGGLVNVFVNALRLGSLSGTGSVNINATSLQVGYLDRNETFAGVISGGGMLVKRGTGTWVLTGANTYAGGTLIATGTLELNGSVASLVTISGPGRLTGTGTVNAAIGNGGTISPGNATSPFGTLTATGAVTFNAGSFLAPTINAAGQSSLLQAGSLVINGGQVRPTAISGGLFMMQTDFRIANGTGGRTGTFTGVDESLLPSFLDASLNYVGNDVFLRIRRNATTFAQTTGLTPNQAAAGGSLDAAVAANNPLVFTTYLSTYNTLLPLSGAQLQGALNVLSGDALTAFPVAAQEHANRFAERLNANTWSNSSNLWALIAYGDQDADGDGNGPGFEADGVEFQIGFNTSLGPNTRLGLSAGMNNGDVSVDDRLTTGNVDTWSVGAQLRHDFGQLYVSGQLTYSWHSVDSIRVLFPGGFGTADYDAMTWTAGGEIGWVIHSGSLSIEPHVSVRHANTSTDAYSESGPVGVLNVAPADYETTRLGIGLRLANRYPAAPVRFYALARYERNSGDDQSALDNALVGLPAFRVVGTELGDDIFSGEVGAEFRISGGLSLFAAGGGHTRTNETSLQANAGLRIVF